MVAERVESGDHKVREIDEVNLVDDLDHNLGWESANRYFREIVAKIIIVLEPLFSVI